MKADFTSGPAPNTKKTRWVKKVISLLRGWQGGRLANLPFNFVLLSIPSLECSYARKYTLLPSQMKIIQERSIEDGIITSKSAEEKAFGKWDLDTMCWNEIKSSYSIVLPLFSSLLAFCPFHIEQWSTGGPMIWFLTTQAYLEDTVMPFDRVGMRKRNRGIFRDLFHTLRRVLGEGLPN